MLFIPWEAAQARFPSSSWCHSWLVQDQPPPTKLFPFSQASWSWGGRKDPLSLGTQTPPVVVGRGTLLHGHS